jgi:hypothetical protein
MTTHSDAYFARFLKASLEKHHPDFAVESVSGKRLGGTVRVMHIHHSQGLFAQFPFPPKGMHAGQVHAALYRTACQMLRLTPNPELL